LKKLTNASKGKSVPIIIGPTGVGKTELSLLLADALNAEIVSADSRQIYRYMDIGTAKPSLDELRRIKHHFIDIINPDEYYSAGEYGRKARECIDQIFIRNVQPIVVGGAGFYIRALIDGLFAPKVSSIKVKEHIRHRIRLEGSEAVFDYLKTVDPKSAQRLHPNDEQRIVRALEVYEITGTPISDFQDGKDDPAQFTPLMIGLVRERQNLYERIEARVDSMLASGLVEEVRELQEMGYGPELNSLRTVGYQEVFEYLDDRLSYAEMTEQIKTHTRQYAKRQLTWFRREKRIRWVDLGTIKTEQIVPKIMSTFCFQKKVLNTPPPSR
jgi:tRNA dimethylallyltransferase